MIRIGIVNDLRLAVEALRRAVATMPEAEVAWIAMDGAQAVAKCAADRPDVVLMDMIMPVMDGVEATRRIMAATPCPILVVTATVTGNAGRVYEALGAGALDAVATPGLTPDGGVRDAEALVRKVRSIALLAGPRTEAPTTPGVSNGAIGAARTAPPMVAIGCSTGGPMVLSVVLRSLPRPLPWPLVIVQHIDTEFASGLAQWLSGETGQRVDVATEGDQPVPGRALVAATADHLALSPDGQLRYVVQPREIVFRPSVDVYFDSLIAAEAAHGVAVVMTGMGRDGAQGLARLRKSGWHTIAQDRASSVVWGMPGACVELGAATEVLAPDSMGAAITLQMTRLTGLVPGSSNILPRRSTSE